MDTSWIITTQNAMLMAVLSAVGIYFTLILLTRLAGVRTFSKISSSDFAVTVAIGTIVGSTLLTKDPPLFQSIIALATLLLLQMGVARFRDVSFVKKLVDNKPILLMKDQEMLKENMKKARVTKDDILIKLREANVTRFSQIKAVVMENTGDISVLHHQDEDHELEEEILNDVKI